MELNERETLIRVEQQLKDSIANQSKIMTDLKEIFSRIESDSKVVAQIKGDLKTHLETNRLKNQDINRRIEEVVRETNENSKRILREREERKESINKEKIERETFEERVKTSIGVFKVSISIIASIATIISAIVLILQFLKG